MIDVILLAVSVAAEVGLVCVTCYWMTFLFQGHLTV